MIFTYIFNMKRLSILLFLLLNGCACQSEDIAVLPVMKSIDKYLNCSNLRKEWIKAYFEIGANESKMDVLPAYAKNITCLIATRLQMEKAQNIAVNRAAYVSMLMREKGCDTSDLNFSLVFPNHIDYTARK